MSELGTFDVIAEKSVLVDYAETFRAIVQEATWHIRDNEIYALPVDPANVCMIEQRLPASAFESYNTDEMDLGLNLETFVDYVEAGDDDLVHLSLDPETRRLDIQCGSVDASMALIDPDSIRNDGDISEDMAEGFVADLEIEDSAALEHAIDVVGMVSDHVRLRVDADGEPPLAVIGEGDTDDMRVTFDSSLTEGSQVDSDGESLYSEEYLSDLSKVLPSGTPVRVRVGDEWPMWWQYDTPDVGCAVRMMIAPRIQSQ